MGATMRKWTKVDRDRVETALSFWRDAVGAPRGAVPEEPAQAVEAAAYGLELLARNHDLYETSHRESAVHATEHPDRYGAGWAERSTEHAAEHARKAKRFRDLIARLRAAGSLPEPQT